MVCKEDVCMWFKNNEPHRRLELLCCLLNMCLPLELHFLKTCIEDLGKRVDFRDSEAKVNKHQETESLSNIFDEQTRSRLVVCVALLGATNHTVSELFFRALTSKQTEPPSSSQLDPNYQREMLLLYTMVLNHPAFTFQQKRVVSQLLAGLQQLQERPVCYPVSFLIPDGGLASSGSCEPVDSNSPAVALNTEAAQVTPSNDYPDPAGGLELSCGPAPAMAGCGGDVAAAAMATPPYHAGGTELPPEYMQGLPDSMPLQYHHQQQQPPQPERAASPTSFSPHHHHHHHYPPSALMLDYTTTNRFFGPAGHHHYPLSAGQLASPPPQQQVAGDDSGATVLAASHLSHLPPAAPSHNLLCSSEAFSVFGGSTAQQESVPATSLPPQPNHLDHNARRKNGEGLEECSGVYGREDGSVPTTYIYNSSLVQPAQHHGVSALGYMCGSGGGNCLFSCSPVDRPSEQCADQQSSAFTSAQSSPPYASPPQSLPNSRPPSPDADHTQHDDQQQLRYTFDQHTYNHDQHVYMQDKHQYTTELGAEQQQQQQNHMAGSPQPERQVLLLPTAVPASTSLDDLPGQQTQLMEEVSEGVASFSAAAESSDGPEPAATFNTNMFLASPPPPALQSPVMPNVYESVYTYCSSTVTSSDNQCLRYISPPGGDGNVQYSTAGLPPSARPCTTAVTTVLTTALSSHAPLEANASSPSYKHSQTASRVNGSEVQANVKNSPNKSTNDTRSSQKVPREYSSPCADSAPLTIAINNYNTRSVPECEISSVVDVEASECYSPALSFMSPAEPTISSTTSSMPLASHDHQYTASRDNRATRKFGHNNATMNADSALRDSQVSPVLDCVVDNARQDQQYNSSSPMSQQEQKKQAKAIPDCASCCTSVSKVDATGHSQADMQPQHTRQQPGVACSKADSSEYAKILFNKLYNKLTGFPPSQLRVMSDSKLMQLGVESSDLARVRGLLSEMETASHPPNGITPLAVPCPTLNGSFSFGDLNIDSLEDLDSAPGVSNEDPQPIQSPQYESLTCVHSSQRCPSSEKLSLVNNCHQSSDVRCGQSPRETCNGVREDGDKHPATDTACNRQCSELNHHRTPQSVHCTPSDRQTSNTDLKIAISSEVHRTPEVHRTQQVHKTQQGHRIQEAPRPQEVHRTLANGDVTVEPEKHGRNGSDMIRRGRPVNSSSDKNNASPPVIGPDNNTVSFTSLPNATNCASNVSNASCGDASFPVGGPCTKEEEAAHLSLRSTGSSSTLLPCPEDSRALAYPSLQHDGLIVAAGATSQLPFAYEGHSSASQLPPVPVEVSELSSSRVCMMQGPPPPLLNRAPPPHMLPPYFSTPPPNMSAASAGAPASPSISEGSGSVTPCTVSVKTTSPCQTSTSTTSSTAAVTTASAVTGGRSSSSGAGQQQPPLCTAPPPPVRSVDQHHHAQHQMFYVNNNSSSSGKNLSASSGNPLVPLLPSSSHLPPQHQYHPYHHLQPYFLPHPPAQGRPPHHSLLFGAPIMQQPPPHHHHHHHGAPKHGGYAAGGGGAGGNSSSSSTCSNSSSSGGGHSKGRHGGNRRPGMSRGSSTPAHGSFSSSAPHYRGGGRAGPPPGPPLDRSVKTGEASGSTDSSPGSSQFSSPPQTPSPDQDTKAIGKRCGEDEGWDRHAFPSTRGCSRGSGEDSTPPLAPQQPPLLLPPHHGGGNPMRPRYLPYPPMNFVPYQTPHPSNLLRYSLPQQHGGRYPAPHHMQHPALDKSSREGTPGPLLQLPPPPPCQELSDLPAASSPALASGGAGGGGGGHYNGPPHSSNYHPMLVNAAVLAHLQGLPPPPHHQHPALPPNFHSLGGVGGMPNLHPELFLAPYSPQHGGQYHHVPPHQQPPLIATLPNGPPYSGAGLSSKKSLSCYNCGQLGHRGTECREASIEEMTKPTKVST